MAFLSLYFSNGETPQLYRTEFTHPLLKECRISIRGKEAGAYGDAGSFQWTRAVKALCILFLRTKALSSHERFLSGEKASPAASLDYALGKLPVWLVEMFGASASGETLTARIFKRSNPESKRPGPVAVGLRENTLPPENISVFLDEHEILDQRELRELLHLLEKGGSEEPDHARAEQPGAALSVETFSRWLEQEILASLNRTNIFNSRMVEERAKMLSRLPRFNRLSGRKGGIISDIDEKLSSQGEALALDRSKLHSAFDQLGRPFRVATSISQAAASALFIYLRDEMNLPIELISQAPHSPALIKELSQADDGLRADAYVLTVGPAAKVLGLKAASHQALMFMPSQSFSLLKKKGTLETEGPLKGEFLVHAEEYSSAFFRLDALDAAHFIDLKGSRISHLELSPSLKAVLDSNGESFTVVGFPYYKIASLSGKLTPVAHSQRLEAFRDTFLFVRKSFSRNFLSCLDAALRDAWLELRRGDGALDAAVATLCTQFEYPKHSIELVG